MALTIYEKRLLNRLMVEKIEKCIEEKKESITVEEFFKYLEENKFPVAITSRSVSSCIDRVSIRFDGQTKVWYENKTIKIIYYDYVIDVSYAFIKEKNLLYLNKGKTLYYDFITKKFNAPKNKIRIINTHNSFKNYENCFKYEWLFNYCYNLREIKRIVDDSKYSGINISVMPTGLYKYLTDNSLELNLQVLRDYVNILKYGKYSKFVKNIGTHNEYIDLFLKNEKIESLVKMAQLTMINGYNPFFFLDEFLELYFTVSVNSNNIIIDTNRNLEYNIELLKNIRDKEKNEKLALQLQKLNFIHNMKIDDYVVIVPQTQADKQAEGKMQNNCVGYYYDNAILKGSDLIYFIRKSTNLNKSYITCRYNTVKQDTVEARKVNNFSINNSKETEIIKQISEIIKENLK